MNPNVIVPFIEELIILVPKEKAGVLHANDEKRLREVRKALREFFSQVEMETRPENRQK